MCPGLNHNYERGKTFYTLQAENGLFLCHPEMYREGDKGGTITVLVSPGMKQQGTSEGGLTAHLYCAWVTYSLEDLREVYAYVAPRFPQESPQGCPKYPYFGQFGEKWGMTTFEQHRRMSGVELQQAKQAAQQSQTGAGEQLKMELPAKYSGVTLSQAALPVIPATPAIIPQPQITQKSQTSSIQEQRSPVGNFAFSLPPLPKK